MQNPGRFFSSVFSWRTLGLMGLLVLALICWFFGPLLALGGLQPLAAVGVRVSLIGLLLLWACLWVGGGAFSLVLVAALCVLVWHGGPLLSVGDVQPLASVGVRLALICMILLACALYWLYRLLREISRDKEFLGRFFKFDKQDEQGGPDDAAKAEIKDVSTRLSRAVAQLKGLRHSRGLLRIFEGNRYLYELPWFMILGNPGAGKTTALLNSGLQFPVARQMGNLPKRMVLESDEGTVHCDWWFTNEAVMIDTAGRYTSHDSSPTKDPVEWRAFLGLLRKHRTRAPINGVIVALNAAQLIGLTNAQLSEQAGVVRDRLAELRQQLGIRFPVYVIVTKLDVLRGFEPYFKSLTTEGRTQTWGFTLPYTGMKGSTRLDAADIAGHREALRKQLMAELALLKDRVAAGSAARLNEEFDEDRRQRLFALPQELAGLSVPLAQMIDEVFLDSRFDSTQLHNTLRGVYLTSGAQAGVAIPADSATLPQRLWRSLGRSPFQSVRAAQDAAAAAEAARQLAEAQDDPLDGSSAESEVPAQKSADIPKPLQTAVDAAPSQPAGRQRPEPINTFPRHDQQGFFLQDVLTKVIIPEAHLVRPNLVWTFRHRMLFWTSQLLVLAIAVMLGMALDRSHGNNWQYLQVVDERAQALAVRVRALFADFKSTDVPEVLNNARELPGYAGLDVGHPPLGFLYGLYAVPPVLDASADTYAQLQDHMLLPPILQRMEAVLAQSVKDGDARTAYETLRVYKLLHDPQRYMQDGGARDVKNWVLKDWATTDSAAAFGGRASMVGHVEALFSGVRPVQSAALPNEALLRDVQTFLGGNTSTQRVYERAKTAMAAEAPQEFTLVRAVGPQAGTVFSRVDGQPLEKGVPGLFTYDGYHELFNRRLPAFVSQALEDDAWVMGRRTQEFATGGLQKKAADEAAGQLRNNPLLEDIRRQYLTEYAQQWDDFLNSIRTVGGTDGTGSSLGFDLTVLRQFAAPDSPLARLARAAARETTLSRPLTARVQEDKSFLDKATDEINRQTKDIGKNLGIRSEERFEKQIVDNRFAALREVVTGQPDAGMGSSLGAAGAKPGLEAVSSLVNEFYTVLVVADTALSTGSLPPGGADIGARLKLEAGKLPAPFREVLTALATSGSDKVVLGATDILRKQAQVQLDRLNGLMAMQVSEPCKRGVEGRYPLAPVAQDATIDDFTQVFAVGGSADDYFTKYLAPFVDTSVRPWRYKSPSTANAMVGAESYAAGGATPPAPATTGPTMLGELLKLLAQSGPNLDAFYRAQQVRELFFRDAGGKKPAWKLELKVLDLDPTITDLIINIDGQGQRYIHGPVQTFTVNWPGPRGGGGAELIANPRVSGPTSTVQASGPWALFRLLDKGRIVSTATSGRVNVEFTFDGRKALLDVSSGSQPNPLNSDVFKGFHCPGTAA